jgi:hypothetical protein
MLRAQGQTPQSPFEHTAVFYWRANRLPIGEPVLRLAQRNFERPDTTRFEPSVFLASREHATFPPCHWRHINWGLIGGILFSTFFWWAFFAFAVPALN